MRLELQFNLISVDTVVGIEQTRYHSLLVALNCTATIIISIDLLLVYLLPVIAHTCDQNAPEHLNQEHWKAHSAAHGTDPKFLVGKAWVVGWHLSE